MYIVTVLNQCRTRLAIYRDVIENFSIAVSVCNIVGKISKVAGLVIETDIIIAVITYAVVRASFKSCSVGRKLLHIASGKCQCTSGIGSDLKQNAFCERHAVHSSVYLVYKRHTGFQKDGVTHLPVGELGLVKEKLQSVFSLASIKITQFKAGITGFIQRSVAGEFHVRTGQAAVRNFCAYRVFTADSNSSIHIVIARTI